MFNLYNILVFFNSKYIWINIIFLLVSIPFLSRYIAFNNNNSCDENGIKVMSYNVRLFNKWGWIDEENIKQESVNFINNQDLDIINIQEYYNPNMDLELNFKYSHIGIQKEKRIGFMAIYSKYPQINKKTVNIDGNTK